MLTKAELKAALQASFDLKYGTGKFTVGDGVEFVAPLADLEEAALKTYHSSNNLVSQSVFAGNVFATGTNASRLGRVKLVYTQLQQQVETNDYWPVAIAVEESMRPQQSKYFADVVFAYADVSDASGSFVGYKFEVATTLSLNESGKPNLGEDGLPYNSN